MNYVESRIERAQNTIVSIVEDPVGHGRVRYLLQIQNAVPIFEDFKGVKSKFTKEPNFKLVCNQAMVDAIKAVNDAIRAANDNPNVTISLKPVDVFTEDEVANKNCEQQQIFVLPIKINPNPIRRQDGTVVDKPFFLYSYDKDGVNKSRSKPLNRETIGILDGIDLEKMDIVISFFVSEQYPDKCTAWLDQLHATQSKAYSRQFFDGEYDGYDADAVPVDALATQEQ